MHFRSVLIDKVESAFFRLTSATDETAKEEESKHPEEKLRKLQRSVGILTFIGELYKVGMLTSNIISICIRSLLDSKSQEKLELLCAVLRTVGKKYDKATQNQPSFKYFSSSRDLEKLDNIIKEMQSIVKSFEISARVCLLVQEVIDLRRSKWVPTQAQGVPKPNGDAKYTASWISCQHRSN